jgi:hypothetical protein
MATAKPIHVQRDGPRRHRWRNALVVVLLLAALGIALVWHRLQAQAVLATSYGARIGCTCHYIGGRGLQDCRKDFEPGMGLVMLSDDAQTRTITARVPLVASQTATFRDGAGCLLQSWAP